MFLYRWMWNQQPAEVKEKRASDATSLQEELKSLLDAKDIKTRAERNYNDEELIEVDNRIRENVHEWKRYDLGVFTTCRQLLKDIDDAKNSYDRLALMENILSFLSDKADFLQINRYFARQLRARFASVYGYSLFQEVVRLYTQIAQDKTLESGLITFEIEECDDAQLMLEIAQVNSDPNEQQNLSSEKEEIAAKVQELENWAAAPYADEKQRETNLVAQIQEMLRESEISPRAKRIEVTKRMFELLAGNRWFMQKYPKFNRVVKDKFYEIIVTFGMVDFVPFYEPLFGEPFPYTV